MFKTRTNKLPTIAPYLAENLRASQIPERAAGGEVMDLNEEQLADLDLTLRLLQALTGEDDSSQMSERSRDFCKFLKLLDDYVSAPGAEEWLSSPLPSFDGLTPREIIDKGRIRGLRGELEVLHALKVESEGMKM